MSDFYKVDTTNLSQVNSVNNSSIYLQDDRSSQQTSSEVLELVKSTFADIRHDAIDNAEIKKQPLEEDSQWVKNYLDNEGTYIYSWKLVENLSSQVVDFGDEFIILECLIDKENRTYEQREFNVSIFSEKEIFLGKKFKLSFYQRPNECKMTINDNDSLVLDEDFPQTNFSQRFANLKLKK